MNIMDFEEAVASILGGHLASNLEKDLNAYTMSNFQVRTSFTTNFFVCRFLLSVPLSHKDGVDIMYDASLLWNEKNEPKACAKRIIAMCDEFASRYQAPMQSLYNQLKGETQ